MELSFPLLRKRKLDIQTYNHFCQGVPQGSLSCPCGAIHLLAENSLREVETGEVPPAAETGRSCWGRGQQDASDSEADAGSRNPGSVTEGDGEGKPFTIKPLHSDKQTFCQSDAVAVSAVSCQRPCPLRHLR